MFLLSAILTTTFACVLPQGSDCEPLAPNQCGGAGKYCSDVNRVCTTSCSETQPCGAGFTCGSNGECWPGSPAQINVQTAYQGTFQVMSLGAVDRGTLDGGAVLSGTFLPRDTLFRLKEGRFLTGGVPTASARVQGRRESFAYTTCSTGPKPGTITAENNEPVQFRRTAGSPDIEVYVPWPVQHTVTTCADNVIGIELPGLTDFARVGTITEGVLLDGGVLSFQTMLTSEQQGRLGGVVNVSVAHSTRLEIIPGR